MTNHDPLCPWNGWRGRDAEDCYICDALNQARQDERERIALIMSQRAEIARQQAKTHNNRLYNELEDAFRSAARVALDATISAVSIPKGSLNLPLPPGYKNES